MPRVPNERFVGKSGMGPRGDAILEADWCVSEFLKELDKLGLTENTIVILLAIMVRYLMTDTKIKQKSW